MRMPEPEPQLLERLVVIEPDITHSEIVHLAEHFKAMNSLNGYDDRFIAKLRRQKYESDSAIIDCFKRIVLAKACAYIARDLQEYKRLSKSVVETKTDLIYRTGDSLFNKGDYSELYSIVVDIGKCIYHELGKIDEEDVVADYSYFMEQVIEICHPESLDSVASFEIGDEEINFKLLQSDAVYERMIGEDECVRQMCELNASLVSPSAGYISVATIGVIGHIDSFLDRFGERYTILSPDHISVEGEDALEWCRDWF